jgi:hypothetical protein
MLGRIEFFAEVRLQGASNEIMWLDYHLLQFFAKLEQKKNIRSDAKVKFRRMTQKLLVRETF